jgi:hypothetical protein
MDIWRSMPRGAPVRSLRLTEDCSCPLFRPISGLGTRFESPRHLGAAEGLPRVYRSSTTVPWQRVVWAYLDDVHDASMDPEAKRFIPEFKADLTGGVVFVSNLRYLFEFDRLLRSFRYEPGSRRSSLAWPSEVFRQAQPHARRTQGIGSSPRPSGAEFPLFRGRLWTDPTSRLPSPLLDVLGSAQVVRAQRLRSSSTLRA